MAEPGTAQKFGTYADFLMSHLPEHRASSVRLNDFRRKARERFLALGLPTRKMESWKYIPLDQILNAPFKPQESSGQGQAPKERLFPHFFEGNAEPRLIFVNGTYSEELSSPQNLPAGASVKNLNIDSEEDRQEIDSQPWENLDEENSPFALVNAFSFTRTLFLRIAKDSKIDAPIYLLFVDAEGRSPHSVTYPRIVLSLENNAHAHIVLNRLSLCQVPYFSNSVMNVRLGKDAKLNLTTLQRKESEAHEFLTVRVKLHERSFLKMTSFIRGGAITRNEVKIDFAGGGASSELYGLSVLSEKSELYQHVIINHRLPDCTSKQIYKNILGGSAKTEFNSLVHVEPGAQKSDSYQLNRNLLLSANARAYSRPQLNIRTDDVRASHGSATGQIEKDELFYLRSRGLSKEMARFLITYGFAEEILGQIEPVPMRKELEESLAGTLQDLTARSEGKTGQGRP